LVLPRPEYRNLANLFAIPFAIPKNHDYTT
jgi:hypothetical protein